MASQLRSARLWTVAAMFAAAGSSASAQETYGIGSNPQGSLFFSIATAISKVMVSQTGLQFRTAPYGGSSTYLPLINKGELAFGMANGGETAFAHKGVELFDGRAHPNLRMVAVTISSGGTIAVPKDSPRKTIADLKGARMGVGYTSGRIFHYLVEAILHANGLSQSKDVVGTPVPDFVAAINAFTAGRLDAAYIPLNAAAGKQAMATIRGGWRYLDFPASPATRRLSDQILPSSRPVPVKKEGYTGIETDPTSVLFVDFYLVAGAHVADDVVYRTAKTMYEKVKDLGEAFGPLKAMNAKEMAQPHPASFHPGAIKFYREVGIWQGS